MSPTTCINILDWRRFVGTINQLKKFAPYQTDPSRPPRELLMSTRLMGPEQTQAFENVKAELTNTNVHAIFEPLAFTNVCVQMLHCKGYKRCAAAEKQLRVESGCLLLSINDGYGETLCQIEKDALATISACEILLRTVDYHFSELYLPSWKGFRY